MQKRYSIISRTCRFLLQVYQEFSKIVGPLTNLLAKDMPFDFNDERLIAWQKLKKKLIFAAIIHAPRWLKPFEIMCDASDFTIGAVLGQRIVNNQHMLYFSSRTLNEGQLNYTMTEKEFLAIVFALEKFCPYLLGLNHCFH